ncbi:MAG TPA: type II toxin-antitoxin system RelE/ParE family toxin [Ktedonobacteraceae bacterium]|nr:type II toxin-antitoxin system RelE/ParE family toxin [Ktedonobacteraceae bacterium]
MKRWEVVLAGEAKLQLASIKDIRLRESLRVSLQRLEYEPDKQGKPLREELAGLRSVRAVGQRYRIIYKLKKEQIIVVVLVLGIRKEGDKKDIYKLAKKLMQSGLLDIE